MEKDGPFREDPKELVKPEWEKHPVYLADMGGLFGAPPNLKCQYCDKAAYELFYGHCRECAKTKDVPQITATPEEFHNTYNRGGSVVVSGIKEHLAQKKGYPWWKFWRWFSKK